MAGHAVKGTEGAAVIKQLEPHKEDYMVKKPIIPVFTKPLWINY